MKPIVILAMFSLPLFLAACSPGMIVLREPKSGQIAECRAIVPEAIHVIPDTSSCAADYQAAGYTRLIP